MKKQTKNKTWRKVKLGEVFSEIESGGRPPGGALMINEGIPSIGAEHLDDKGGFDFSNIKYVPEKYFNNSVRGRIKENDVLVVKDGATIGKVSRISKNFPFPQAMINEHVFIIRGKKNLIDQNFLFYKISTREGKETIKNSVGGSAQGGLKKDFLDHWEVYLPNLNEQKRIAEILSTFDDKIELNNKISKNLEAIAQAIFKEWFVKFKFPGHEKAKFIDSELGKIPKGWEVKQFGDGIITEVISNGIDKFNGEKIYLATADVDGKEISNTKTKITYDKRPSRADMQPIINSMWFAKMINTYKILFFFDGNKEDLEKFILSTGFMGIKCNNGSEFFMYLFISSKKFHSIKDTLVQGAVQEALTLGNIKRVKILIPSKEVLLRFNEIIKPMFGKIYKNRLENQKLASLRDLLLPKLMSGEIRV